MNRSYYSELIFMALAYITIMLVIGYMTGNDVQGCMDKGNSYVECNDAFGG